MLEVHKRNTNIPQASYVALKKVSKVKAKGMHEKLLELHPPHLLK